RRRPHRGDLPIELGERLPVLSGERGPCAERGGAVRPTDDVVQTDVQPRLQIGRRLDEPRRRRRLQAVRITEAADGEQTVPQMQESKQRSGYGMASDDGCPPR